MTFTTKPAHTPTPWHVHSSAGETSVRSGQGLSKIARIGASERAKADAAFIVRVNVHADLIAALKEARAVFTPQWTTSLATDRATIAKQKGGE